MINMQDSQLYRPNRFQVNCHMGLTEPEDRSFEERSAAHPSDT